MRESVDDHSFGRAICTWVEAIGWALILAGAIVVVAGLGSSGATSGSAGNFGSSGLAYVSFGYILLQGFFVSSSGLVAMLLAQNTRANINTSIMTRQLLELTKGYSSLPDTLDTEAKTAIVESKEHDQDRGFDSQGFNENGERIYRNVTIRKNNNKYYVESKEFSTLGKAKRFIADRDSLR